MKVKPNIICMYVNITRIMFTFLNIIYNQFLFVCPLVAHLQFVLYTYFHTHNAPAFASVWIKCLLWQWTHCRSRTWLNTGRIFEGHNVSLLLTQGQLSQWARLAVNANYTAIFYLQPVCMCLNYHSSSFSGTQLLVQFYDWSSRCTNLYI